MSRYDYDGARHRLVIRRPTNVHKLFTYSVEHAISRQLELIRKGTDKAAAFAQKLYLARTTEIFFPIEGKPTATKSKHDPDTAFRHKKARFPGVIIEVACSQKKKRLFR